MLAMPATTLPGIFAPGAVFGYDWIQRYPFALPSLMNAVALSAVTAIVMLFLEEVCICHM